MSTHINAAVRDEIIDNVTKYLSKRFPVHGRAITRDPEILDQMWGLYSTPEQRACKESMENIDLLKFIKTEDRMTMTILMAYDRAQGASRVQPSGVQQYKWYNKEGNRGWVGGDKPSDWEVELYIVMPFRIPIHHMYSSSLNGNHSIATLNHVPIQIRYEVMREAAMLSSNAYAKRMARHFIRGFLGPDGVRSSLSGVARDWPEIAKFFPDRHAVDMKRTQLRHKESKQQLSSKESIWVPVINDWIAEGYMVPKSKLQRPDMERPGIYLTL